MRLLSCLVMMLWVFPVIGETTASAPNNIEILRTALEQRATTRWDALIRKDFATAYSLTSPGYRKLYSLDAFKGKFGGKTAWRRIEIVDVAFKGDDAATVGINLHFVYYQAQSEQALDMTTYVQESWVREDDQWWYLVRE